MRKLRKRVPFARPKAKNRPEVASVLAEKKLVLPSALDFLNAPEETTEFFEKLRKLFDGRQCKSAIVDHRPLKAITPAAALVLLAEMYRATTLHKSVGLFFIKPEEPATSELLRAIGYYDYSEDSSWGNTLFTKRFWKHRRGEGVQTDAARDLISYLPPMEEDDRQKLYEALVEGMQNASEHAYRGKGSGYRSWWLLGYSDEKTGEMAFCFYDQGDGIPETIRTRLKDTLPFVARSGSELIRTAVMEGRYSRTQKPERGRGLPTLNRFIETAPDGQMVIFSLESRCVFQHLTRPLCHDYRRRLPGTVISWHLMRDDR